MTQRELGARAGRSQALISDIERGEWRPDWGLAAALASAVGHELSVRLYPRRSVSLRDSGQLSMATAIVSSAHAGWHADLEVPVASGDLRAADLLLRGPDEILHIEIERRLVDFQAQLRSAQLKRQLFADREERPVRLILAVPDTRRLRGVLLEHDALLRRTMPATSREIWRSITLGAALPGDGILRLDRRRITPV